MIGRREPTNPETAALIRARLDHLLAENAPRRSAPTVDDEVVGDEQFVSAEPGPAPLPDLPERKVQGLVQRFGRWHVTVVVLLLMAGLALAGWTVLRARPVAVASGPPVVTESPGLTASSDTGKQSPSPSKTSAAGSDDEAGGDKKAVSIVVHVLGAVADPGLVELPAGARVQDALDAAGGLRKNAAPSDLNLAQVLLDGQQVFIGTKGKPAGEVRDASQGSGSGSSASSPDVDQGTSSKPGAGRLLNLNSATAAQLEELPGVGPVTASKIVAWREEHKRFSRVEELQEVSGIGPKTFAEIAPQVTAP